MLHSRDKSIVLLLVSLALLFLMVGCSEDKSAVGPDHSAAAPLSCSIDNLQESGSTQRQISVSASATGGSAPYRYTWDFGDMHNSTGSSASHTYAADGNYQISMTVTDGAGASCSKDTVVQIQTTADLTCMASANVTSGTPPLSVRFSSTVSGGTPAYSYTWQFGDGSVSHVANPTHAYTNIGTYTAKLTIRDASGAQSSSSITITVTTSAATLTCSLGANPISGYAPLAVSFTGNADGGTAPYGYQWQFGDGATSTAKNPTHNYLTQGNYSARLIVTDAASETCQKTVLIQVTSRPAGLTCQANASPASGQAPLTVAFTCTASGGTSPYQYTWSFGDGGSSSVRSPAHTFTTAGTYTSRVTVRDLAGATAQSTVTITVSAGTPALDCTASATPTSGAAPLGVAFTGSATGGTTPYTYRWQFGDGSTSTQPSPNHTYQSGGSYTATFTATDAGSNTCSKTISITVSQPPAGPNLSGPNSVPEGQSFALTWRYTWPSLATTGEKVVLERSTTGSTSGFTAIAEIPRGGSTQFLIVNPQEGRYFFRARARVSIAGHLTWTTYSSVVTVDVEAVVSRTRFNNTGTYFIVSLEVDGVEQFTSSPQGLPSGYYYELELAPGSHSYEALFGFWNSSDQRDYLYRTTGTFVQRSGVTENVPLPGPTIRDLLTKFSSSGLWTAWIPGAFQKAGYRFYANGTYDFYIGDELTASGTYSFVSRNATTWAVTFSDGYSQGVLYEYLGYFIMYNGPDGAALQYFHEGP